MKYLILIHSNPRAARSGRASPTSSEPRACVLRRPERDLVASGELIVSEALADPSLGQRLPARPDAGRPRTGRSPRRRSTWPASSWSSARAWNARSRSPRGCRRPTSASSRCGRSWTSARRTCEHDGRGRGPAARAGAAGPRRARPALRRLRHLRGRRPGGAAGGGAAVAGRRRAGQPEGLADHRRVPPADRDVAQRVGPPAARGDRRRGRGRSRSPTRSPTSTTRSRCCCCAATRRSRRSPRWR